MVADNYGSIANQRMDATTWDPLKMQQMRKRGRRRGLGAGMRLGGGGLNSGDPGSGTPEVTGVEPEGAGLILQDQVQPTQPPDLGLGPNQSTPPPADDTPPPAADTPQTAAVTPDPVVAPENYQLPFQTWGYQDLHNMLPAMFGQQTANRALGRFAPINPQTGQPYTRNQQGEWLGPDGEAVSFEELQQAQWANPNQTGYNWGGEQWNQNQSDPFAQGGYNPYQQGGYGGGYGSWPMAPFGSYGGGYGAVGGGYGGYGGRGHLGSGYGGYGHRDVSGGGYGSIYGAVGGSMQPYPQYGGGMTSGYGGNMFRSQFPMRESLYGAHGFGYNPARQGSGYGYGGY